MESKQKKELIRIVGDGKGSAMLDATGKAPGRGAYICPSTECFKKARKKYAISRSLGFTLSEQKLDELFEELSTYEKKQD